MTHTTASATAAKKKLGEKGKFKKKSKFFDF